MLALKAEDTIRTYLAGFKRWKLWASSNCFRHMPANSFYVDSYLQCLFCEANSPSPDVLNAVCSINWAQSLAGLPKVYDHSIVSSKAWPVFLRSMIILSFLPWSVRPKELWGS